MGAQRPYDFAVVGAGILGLAHAYHLAMAGRSVVVLERSSRAQGASVRNFGMIWPIGQPPGHRLQMALRSREIWESVLDRAGIWHSNCGSLHLAHHPDEAAVIEEFAHQAAGHGYRARRVDRKQVAELAPRVRGESLECALHSDTEMCVDPRTAIPGIAQWLARECRVEFRFDCLATGFEPGRVVTSRGPIEADRLIVCSGHELQALYPSALGAAGLTLCKLQMMRGVLGNDRAPLGPMLATGLTLRHYSAFRECRELPRLCERLDREFPELGRYGIHVLVSQNAAGELTLGDSHEYGAEVEPFDQVEIDRLILDYLGRFLDLSNLELTERWHGLYVRHASEPYVRLEPAPGVTAVTGLGGAGMTLSFGLAEQVVGPWIQS